MLRFPHGHPGLQLAGMALLALLLAPHGRLFLSTAALWLVLASNQLLA